MNKQNHTIEKSAGAGAVTGFGAGIAYTAVAGKIGIAFLGTATGLTVILPATIAGVALGSTIGMRLKHRKKLKHIFNVLKKNKENEPNF